MQTLIEKYRFLLWAILPLATLIGTGIWFESTEIEGQLKDLKEIVGSEISYKDESKELSDKATLAFISSIQLSNAVNFLLLLSSIVVIVFSVVALFHNLEKRSILVAIATAGFIAFIGIFMHLHQDGSVLDQWYFTSWTPYVEEKLAEIDWVLYALVYTTNISVALLVVSVSTFLAPGSFRTTRIDSDQSGVSSLIRQTALLRSLLYASSISMTVGVLAIYFGLSVGAAPVLGDLNSSLTRVVSGLAFLYGVGHTAFLSAAFLPVLFYWSARKDKHTVGLVDSDHTNENYQKDDAGWSFSKEFTSFSAILGPFVSGVATFLFENLAG
jgi:hypothetical protein